jgi:peroxiredoxin
MNSLPNFSLAPPLDVVGWLNTTTPLSLEQLKGKIVVIHAFQMLCPGCVSHGLPQASNIYNLYNKEQVQVIGLHTVFEHHNVMTIGALRAFVHEYRLAFPIAIDRPSDASFIPHTMARYHMQGTPTLIIIDKNGFLRANHFGRMSDLQVGSIIGGLLEEKSASVKGIENTSTTNDTSLKQCGDDGCLV